MKTAFVTSYDARDVRHWSGLGYFISRALARSGLDIEHFGPIEISPLVWLLVRSRGFWHNRVRHQRYLRNHDLVVARHFARRVERRLARRSDIELIFSPGTIPIAFVRDPRPLAYWSDATHAGIFDFYADYTGMCRQNMRDGHRIEQAAMDRAAAVLFASDWAAASACNGYGVPPERVHVVPFGANIEQPPTDADCERFLDERPRDRCRLLFAGVDWLRKGGPLAVEVAELLNRQGIPTELTVVGCNPFPAGGAPPFVRVSGFLDKSKPADETLLRQLFADSHFLVLPSLAECYGIVYCEASAFAMPSLARRVGGVPTIISHDETGWLFDEAAGAESYAAIIGAVFSRWERYREVALAARRTFVERLNWEVAGRQAAALLRDCARPRRLQYV